MRARALPVGDNDVEYEALSLRTYGALFFNINSVSGAFMRRAFYSDGVVAYILRRRTLRCRGISTTHVRHCTSTYYVNTIAVQFRIINSRL